MREAVLRYALRGVPVHPLYWTEGDACACDEGAECTSAGKHPITSNGLLDATTDPRRIRSWWGHWSKANVGIPTGVRFDVLDIDCKAGRDGWASLRCAEADLGDLPETASVTTPNGTHLLFLPSGVRNRQSTISKRGDAPGVDVRGIGGYVVAPPSEVFGKAYTWRSRKPIAALPPAWVKALSDPERPLVEVPPWRPSDAVSATRTGRWVRRALEREQDKVRSTPKGQRNERLYDSGHALAGYLHTGLISEDDIVRALLHACSSWESRTPRKDESTIRNGIEDGAARPREVLRAG